MISNIIIKKNDKLKIQQMQKIELKSDAALITKYLLLNKNIGKLLFENLQTKLTLYTYFLAMRTIASLLSPSTPTISRREAEGNSWCRGGQ